MHNVAEAVDAVRASCQTAVRWPGGKYSVFTFHRHIRVVVTRWDANWHLSRDDFLFGAALH